MRIAQRLIEHRARAKLVQRATDLPWRTVTAMYREVHGASPPRGQYRHSAAGLVKTRSMQVLATAFAVRFLAHAGARPRRVSGEHWLAAYEEWRALTPERFHAQLSINDAWRVAEDLRITAWCPHDAGELVYMTQCGVCGKRHLTAPTSLLHGCPHCAGERQARAAARAATTAQGLPEIRHARTAAGR